MKILKDFLEKNEYIKEILLKELGTDIVKDFVDLEKDNTDWIKTVQKNNLRIVQLEKENKELREPNENFRNNIINLLDFPTHECLSLNKVVEKIEELKEENNSLKQTHCERCNHVKNLEEKYKEKADKFDKFDPFAIAIDLLIKGEIESIIGFGDLTINKMNENRLAFIGNLSRHQFSHNEFKTTKKEIEKEDYYFEFDKKLLIDLFMKEITIKFSETVPTDFDVYNDDKNAIINYKKVVKEFSLKKDFISSNITISLDQMGFGWSAHKEDKQLTEKQINEILGNNND
jgi:cell division protein FtsB